MSVKYEDLQYLESEKKSQRFTEALFSSQTFLKRLLSSPCLLLLSLALSLLLASICVMGYQNFKFQSDLQTLRTSFSNFTSNSMAEVQALNSQGRNFQEMITSLKAEVESHKQELQAARSLNDKVLSLENRLEKQLEELKAGDSEMLLRVQQLVKNLNSLTCKMDALKSNGSQNTACCPANWLEHEGHCYWFSSLRKPWPEAEKDCQLKNAQLVVINSRDEQDFIQANLHPYFTWMGLSDPDGVWKWVDGSDYETNINLAIWANHITFLSLSDFICKMGGTPFHRVIVKMQHDVYMSLAHHKKSFSFRSVLEGVLSLSTQHALHGGL
ncbi:C-type lectin domain family 10 member A-like isoform X1 [Bos javanicus]|uniref:C-type lectin domain family 10 member A-like isoform X1 n=2 Tax=Bos javanicus TaxID=9906 RepID=UPI002AA6432D|nr:C-type lectin domain family 10 member A-like isoform X1 [Bos javanicus]